MSEALDRYIIGLHHAMRTLENNADDLGWVERDMARDAVSKALKAAMADESTAPTSAAGATKPNELTSSPEPAPALRAAEWVETAMRLAEAYAAAYTVDAINGRHDAAARKDQCENAVRAHLSRASGLLPVAREGLSDEQLRAMVNRFLGWPLPTTFGPDCGIKFTPLAHPNGWPTGTNLFTASEAKAMLEYIVAPVLAPASGDAPGEAK